MFLNYLKENPDCLYIYNRDFSIYGAEPKEQYTIVVKDEWKCPEEFQDYNPFVYQIYKISDWFKLVLSGSIIAWECACLNRKYVIKEHVKLMMTTNPLQLRKDVEELRKEVYESISIAKEWALIKLIVFANQIIENHKIINFKEPISYFNRREEESLDQVIEEPYNKLKSLTDGMLEKEKLNKIKKWAKS